jgi:hypothetical protein
MKKQFTTTVSLLLLLSIFSCRKANVEPLQSQETIEELSEDGKHGNKADCGYYQARTNRMSVMSDIVTPLFTGEYDHSGRIKKIIVNFRHIIGGYWPEINTPLIVTHQYRKSIFVNETNGDTVAIVKYNQQGKPIWARTIIHLMYNSDLEEFRFSYIGGKISSIQTCTYQILNPPTEDQKIWINYIRLNYDKTGKNVSKMTVKNGNISIQHDYSIKPKAQYYPGLEITPMLHFWNLLIYMNTFPEVHPQNLVTSTLWIGTGVDEYVERHYVKNYDHKFDHAGRLVYYKAQAWTDFLESEPYKEPLEHWYIDWRCNRRN